MPETRLGLAECLEALARALESCEPGLLQRSLLAARRALEQGDAVCAYSWLRLGLEAATQYAYYLLQGIDWDKALERIRRRSRAAASFTATMIKRLRGVHGSRKHWILRVYLWLGEYLHPSAEMHAASGEPGLREELVREVLDAIAYLCLVAGREPLLQDGLVAGCGLEKTGRLLARRSP